MIVADVYSHLQDDITYVEHKLNAQLKCSQPLLQEAARHLLVAGGKRLRPVFVLLAGTLGTFDRERLSKVAVALELIHMATLVHDDVIDHAETRRGTPTVKSRFGNRMAMYTGDFIFAQAQDILSEVPDVRIHRILAHAIERMVVGEIEQIRDLFSLQQSLRQYLKRIRRKTALLIEMSCTLGAIAVGASEQNVLALRRYGYCTGMAFQIKDDILDFTASAERLGKPVGGDLRQGNITVPVLYALKNNITAQRLAELISPEQTETDLTEAIDLVKTSGGIERAQSLAECYLEKAYSGLAGLPDGDTRAALFSLADFIGQREY